MDMIEQPKPVISREEAITAFNVHINEAVEACAGIIPAMEIYGMFHFYAQLQMMACIEANRPRSPRVWSQGEPNG